MTLEWLKFCVTKKMMMLQHISPHFVAGQPPISPAASPVLPTSRAGTSPSPTATDSAWLRKTPSPQYKAPSQPQTPVKLEPPASPQRNPPARTDEAQDPRIQEPEPPAEERIERRYVLVKADPEYGNEDDDDMPLDLSLKYSDRRRDRQDPGTDSDDSGGPGEDRREGRAYKKSLMKRYCKSTTSPYQTYSPIA